MRKSDIKKSEIAPAKEKERFCLIGVIPFENVVTDIPLTLNIK